MPQNCPEQTGAHEQWTVNHQTTSLDFSLPFPQPKSAVPRAVPVHLLPTLRGRRSPSQHVDAARAFFYSTVIPAHRSSAQRPLLAANAADSALRSLSAPRILLFLVDTVADSALRSSSAQRVRELLAAAAADPTHRRSSVVCVRLILSAAAAYPSLHSSSALQVLFLLVGAACIPALRSTSGPRVLLLAANAADPDLRSSSALQMAFNLVPVAARWLFACVFFLLLLWPFASSCSRVHVCACVHVFVVVSTCVCTCACHSCTGPAAGLRMLVLPRKKMCLPIINSCPFFLRATVFQAPH